MTIEIINCDQGTTEWFEARMGIPTASEFSIVMAEGRDGTIPNGIMDAMVKSGCSAAQLAAAVKAAKARGASPSAARLKYMRTLAADILRGFPEEDTFTNAHMDRGTALEDDARQLYSLIKGEAPQRVGFIKDGRKGCSPDSLIGDKGGLEIKTALGHIQIERLMLNRLPPEHKAQVQGSLWVTGREWWDFCSYSPGLEPLIVRVERDEEYIAQLAKAIEAFNTELDSIVQSIRTYQNFKAQAA